MFNANDYESEATKNKRFDTENENVVLFVRLRIG